MKHYLIMIIGESFGDTMENPWGFRVIRRPVGLISVPRAGSTTDAGVSAFRAMPPGSS